MRKTDTLGRRMRTKRKPTGKRIYLAPRDLLWFKKLHQHGPLPTSYLHAFSAHLAKDKGRALKRLADLYNDGEYLIRPKQQFQTIDARCNQLVYDLDRRAEAVLKQEALWSEYAPKPYGPWVHRLMVSCVTASLELGTLDRPDLLYIPQQQILKRAGTGLRINVSYDDPATKKTYNGDLIPDAVCGIEYTKDGTKHYRFFAIEADRNTEPNRSGRFDRKSFKKSILQYRHYVGGGLYKKHLKLTSPLMVLVVTTSDRHMDNLIKLVSEIAPSGRNSFMCFQTVSDFAVPFRPPSLLPCLFWGRWKRAGHAVLFIDRS